MQDGGRYDRKNRIIFNDIWFLINRNKRIYEQNISSVDRLLIFIKI
jgi:hypothetical protein